MKSNLDFIESLQKMSLRAFSFQFHRGKTKSFLCEFLSSVDSQLDNIELK